MLIVRVTIEAVPDRLFDYAVPATLAEAIRLGQRVRVSFGPRTVSGYVIEKLEIEPPPELPTEVLPLFATDPAAAAATAPVRRPKLKAVQSIDDPEPFLSPVLLKLARWVADYYCAPLTTAVRCVLPAPVRDTAGRAKEQLFVSLPEDVQPTAPPDETADDEAPGAAVPQPPVRKKKRSKDKSAATPGLPELSARQTELLDNLRRVGGGWMQAVCKEFSCAPETLRRLAETGAIVLEKRQMRRDPLARRRVVPTQPLPLMDEQADALARITEQIDAISSGTPRPVLLYGVTGSGKTEVYLQAIANVLATGRGAIVLVPEIALTPQTVQRFTARFGSQVAVLHSALGDGERYDEWHRIRKGEARIVVGPRSAVFAPVHPLGLIVVDEEHEPSYKQDEAPRYHARDVAAVRAFLENGVAVFGTATPALETWANVTKGKYLLAALRKRVDDRPLPRVHIVDMRVETQKTGHVQVFSQALIDAVKLRLERGEQTILFLNRRGFSSSLVCPACGYVAECEACSVSMTYHQTDDCLRCHICGAWRRVPATCPSCRDPAFKYTGFGTQRIEAVTTRIFPQARIVRMDADATSRRHSHDDLLAVFQSGRADILIGTQMIAKGHHFPNVTLVGVLAADMSLHQPDFRAAERTFQLLAQVSGRAGRGDVPGEVYVQTYTPEHPAVQCSRKADFDTFAVDELKERRACGYPPYGHLVCLAFRGATESAVLALAQAYAAALTAAACGEISEAVPAPLARAKGEFRYQILMRGVAVKPMVTAVRMAIKKHPPTKEVAIAVDVDALSMM